MVVYKTDFSGHNLVALWKKATNCVEKSFILEQWIIPFHADELNTHLHTKNDLQKLQRISLDILGKMFLAPYVKKKVEFHLGKKKKKTSREQK